MKVQVLKAATRKPPLEPIGCPWFIDQPDVPTDTGGVWWQLWQRVKRVVRIVVRKA